MLSRNIMKIGVLTYWYGNSNYGMILQCWALQQYLKKKGHEPFVIRYQPKQTAWKRVVKELILLLKGCMSSEKRIAYRQSKLQQLHNSQKDKERCFQTFRDEHLTMSDCFYQSLKHLQNTPPEADCYIAGSDQIWSNQLKPNRASAYYLHFGPKEVKRVAYAPSFGTVKYDGKNQSLLADALKALNAISCRENEGVEVCKRAGFDASKVEDPTMLLSKEDYMPLLESSTVNTPIFIYSVNMQSADDIYWNDLVKIFAKKDIVITPSSGSISGGELFGNDIKYIYATVGEWLSLINNSQLVITSSFHGVVFSIIFNKRFCFVPLKGTYSKTNNRIFDLLDSLELNDFIVNTPKDYKRIIESNIDWSKVEERKVTLLSDSYRFLQNALA